jgi:hypothetical protein
MKRHILKKTAAAIAIALTTTIGSAMSVSAATNAAPSKPSSTAKSQESLATKDKILEERLLKVEHEALEAVTGTQNALMALQKKDPKKALALLLDVSGKLDILLAKYPGLSLLPANVEADVYDFDGDSKQVKKLIDAADDLLEDHKVQDARHILDELISEMRISTTSIPLGTFPVAIKEAVNLIDKGKTDAAESALYDILNMLVKTTEILPLPVLRAEALLTAASELEHKSDLTQAASRTEILKLTDAAKDKLKLAELLGYGAKDDYKVLYDAIDEIKNVMFSEKSAVAWDKIKASLTALKNKIIHPGK